MNSRIRARRRYRQRHRKLRVRISTRRGFFYMTPRQLHEHETKYLISSHIDYYSGEVVHFIDLNRRITYRDTDSIFFETLNRGPSAGK